MIKDSILINFIPLKKESLQRIALHVLFWLGVIFYSTYLFGYPDNIKSAFISLLLGLPVDMIYIYSVLYFLIPRFLLKKRYIIFAVLFIIFGLADEFINRVLFFFVYFPDQYSNLVFWDFKDLLNLFSYYYYVILAAAIKLMRIWIQKNKEAKLADEYRHQAELKLKEAELKLLKAQVHPHFLFNTLNNLYGLTLVSSKKAPETVLKLSAILDYMLYRCNSSTVSLKNETEHIKNYIDLEKMRYEDKDLDISFRQEGNIENIKIAPLLLLPFVENAFKHGVSNNGTKSWIKVEMKLKNKTFNFKTENSKAFLHENKNNEHKQGIGLQNVKNRLALSYKNNYVLDIKDTEDYFSVNLTLNLY